MDSIDQLRQLVTPATAVNGTVVSIDGAQMSVSTPRGVKHYPIQPGISVGQRVAIRNDVVIPRRQRREVPVFYL